MRETEENIWRKLVKVKITRFIVLISLMSMINGCSFKQQSYANIGLEKVKQDIRSKNRDLVRRFSEYWHYRLLNNYKKIYNYELPYQRYLIPFSRYKALLAGYGKKAKVNLLSIDRNKNIAIVKREVVVGNKRYQGFDKWIFVDGEWCHKFFQNILPPKTEEEAKFQ